MVHGTRNTAASVATITATPSAVPNAGFALGGAEVATTFMQRS
ncbi:MAG: hypothetical protein ACTHJJ_16470 [Intrasporangium sp.]